jgi:hypothetical protein
MNGRGRSTATPTESTLLRQIAGVSAPGEVDHDAATVLAWECMPIEVPPHVEEILGSYPELLDQWKAQIALPCMQGPGWSGTLKRYLDPVYLRRVASEHRRLVEGNIERPGVELSTAIEAALQLHAGMRQQRAEHLSDPWWRADSYEWNGITEYHDPEYLRRFAHACIAHDDPFSPESIRVRELLEDLQAGGTYQVTKIASAEVVNTFTTEGSRQGAARRN